CNRHTRKNSIEDVDAAASICRRVVLPFPHCQFVPLEVVPELRESKRCWLCRLFLWRRRLARNGGNDLPQLVEQRGVTPQNRALAQPASDRGRVDGPADLARRSFDDRTISVDRRIPGERHLLARGKAIR